MPVIKGRYVCDALFHTFNIGVLNLLCQWLALGVWWHALAFVRQKISWRRAHVANGKIDAISNQNPQSCNNDNSLGNVTKWIYNGFNI